MKRIRVIERKPPKDAWGLSVFKENKILVSPDCPSERFRMGVILHEMFHLLNPEERESVIKRKEKAALKLLWDDLGYRPIKD